MKVRVEGGRTLTLSTREFVAEGGEGKVWARKGVAYKVYADPGRVLPESKIAALRSIASPDVVTPDHRLLDPGSGVPIGYTMRHVAGAWTLGQLFARSFCDRHGFGPTDACTVIDAMREAIAAVHHAGVLVVDLSDANVLVDTRDRRLIDPGDGIALPDTGRHRLHADRHGLLDDPRGVAHVDQLGL